MSGISHLPFIGSICSNSRIVTNCLALLFDFTYDLQQCIQALEPLLKKRVMLLQQTLNIRRIKGFELAQQRIRTDVSGTGNDDIGQFINAMVAVENHHRCCTLRESLSLLYQPCFRIFICCVPWILNVIAWYLFSKLKVLLLKARWG